MGFKIPFGDKIQDIGSGLANFASPLKSFFADSTPSEPKSNLLLPINPLLKDYNIGKDLFRVKLSSRGWKSTEVQKTGEQKADKDNGRKNFEMELLYAAPSLSVSHSFDWSNSFVGEVLEGANQATRAFSRIKNTLQTGNVFQGAQTGFGGLDVAPIFKGSSRPSFTFNFILLAHTDPFLEVVLPAQFLTYLAYPQIKPENKDSLVDMLNGHSNSFPQTDAPNISPTAMENLSSPGKKGDGKDTKEQPAESAEGILDELGKAFGSDGGNNWRYQTGSQPNFWSVETSSGVMNMKYAHISSLDITYHSPWVSPVREYEGKYAKSLQFANAVKSIVGSGAQGGESGVGSMVKSIFPNALDFGKSAISSIGSALPGSLGEGLADFSGETDPSFEGGYPSYAEVSITLTSNYEKIFGEDWLVRPEREKINVSKGTAASGIFDAANSVIKNVF